MVDVQKEFPAAPPADTIALSARDVLPLDALPVPFPTADFDGIRHPAVATQTSVFFAVNPSHAMFQVPDCFPIESFAEKNGCNCVQNDDSRANCFPPKIACKRVKK